MTVTDATPVRSKCKDRNQRKASFVLGFIISFLLLLTCLWAVDAGAFSVALYTYVISQYVFILSSCMLVIHKLSP